MADFQIEITTPEKLVVSKRADFAEIPGKDGYIGVLPGHAALLSELGTGELKVVSAGKTESYTVTGGYLEVRDNQVRVLADSVS
jgi:F-type H+-transporting ATPase subunit epsilon